MPHHSAAHEQQHSNTYRKINSQNVTEEKNQLSTRAGWARLVSRYAGDNKTSTAPPALRNIHFCLCFISTATNEGGDEEKIKFWHVSLIYQSKSKSKVMLIFNADFDARCWYWMLAEIKPKQRIRDLLRLLNLLHLKALNIELFGDMFD